MLRCCLKHLVNPWALHVSARRNVLDMVDHLVEKGILIKDPRQRAMAELCTPLLQAIQDAGSPKTSSDLQVTPWDWRSATLRRAKLFFRELSLRMGSTSTAIDIQWPEQIGAAPVSSGLYIWGGVGIGKTMVLDLFEMCPTPHFTKRRCHLHSFMTMLSDRLHAVEQTQREDSRRGLPTRRPIEVVVEEIIGATPILCFDEFQTFDVAHAALLVEFFTLAFERGVFLMTTSNRPPHELFHLSSTFGNFLPALYRHCSVVNCGDIRDYRCVAAERGALHQQVFLSPNTDGAERRIMECIQRTLPTGAVWKENVAMPLYGRNAIVPKVCSSVAIFDFSEICGKTQLLGPQDFEMFARSFEAIVIFNVPQIGVVSRNAAKQFIILVDELYQYKVKLLFTSCVRWEHLFDEVDVLTGAAKQSHPEDQYADGADERSFGDYLDTPNSDEERLSFARVKSRLYEMGSSQYLLAPHLEFNTSDFDARGLLFAHTTL